MTDPIRIRVYAWFVFALVGAIAAWKEHYWPEAFVAAALACVALVAAKYLPKF